MRVLSLLPVALLALMGCGGQKSPLEQLRGSWEVVQQEPDGQWSEYQPNKKTVIAFSDDSAVITRSKVDLNTMKETEIKKTTVRMKIGVGAKPMTIDLYTEGEQERSLGIFQFDGADLKICTSLEGPMESFQALPPPNELKRPAEFKSAPGVVLMVLDRTDKKPAPAKPLADAQGKLTVEGARELLPKAAAMDLFESLRLGASGELKDDIAMFKNRSLSTVVCDILDTEEKVANAEIRIMKKPIPAALYPSRKGREYLATILQPEYITDCTLEASDTEKAAGTVSFRSNLCEGKVKFLAEKRGQEWTITEFQLPNLGARFTLKADGNWEKTPMKAK